MSTSFRVCNIKYHSCIDYATSRVAATEIRNYDAVMGRQVIKHLVRIGVSITRDYRHINTIRAIIFKLYMLKWMISDKQTLTGRQASNNRIH